MRNYKYLDDLGVPKEEQYQNWFDTTKGDSREPLWEEQRAIYGIDERATWNWNTEFIDYVYVHLKMYNEVNCVDLTYHKVDFEGKTYSVQEAIDEILEWLEKEYYPERDLREDTSNIEGFYKEYERKIRLFAVIITYLWW